MRIAKEGLSDIGTSRGSGHVGHAHFWERLLSRRQFVGTSAAAGALLGSRLLLPKLVFANERAAPRPIPGVSDVVFPPDPRIFPIHVFDPVAGKEPSTITDFDGLVGVAEIVGQGTGFDKNGKKTTLFFDTDMRFMKGEFIGLDGEEREGTFALVWLDLFTDPEFEVQIHDFNPGIESSGLFWTMPLREDAVDVELDDEVDINHHRLHHHPEPTHSTATMEVRNEAIDDYFDFENALKGVRPKVPATTSFKVVWGGVAKPYQASDPGFIFKGLQTEATIEWSAREVGFEFDSDPPQTSKALFAAFGKERNGLFRNRT